MVGPVRRLPKICPLARGRKLVIGAKPVSVGITCSEHYVLADLMLPELESRDYFNIWLLSPGGRTCSNLYPALSTLELSMSKNFHISNEQITVNEN